MNDLVSIITPSYNTANFIAETINCVLNQTYKNFEMIIVDDCSTDNTDEIVMSFHDDRLRYLKNDNNIGAAMSRNRALREAKGKWVAFLDSDDLWEENKLEKQIHFMEEKGYYFSYTNYTEIDEHGVSLGYLLTGPKRINSFFMLTFNYMGCLTVMYNREYVGLIQVADLKKRNDYAMWIKVSKKCPAYLLNDAFAMYRVRTSGSIMDRNKGSFSRIKYNYVLFRDGEKMSTIYALFWTGMNMLFGTFKKAIYRRKI